MRYKQYYEGDVVTPVRRGFKWLCCDCGLVHRLDFFIKKDGRGSSIQFRVRRDERATAAARRKIKKPPGKQRRAESLRSRKER